MSDWSNPMVSVRLMTYNHAPFIRQAMDGIFSQELPFKIEVIVGDDFSTDNTLEIVRSYSDTGNIRIIILNRTVGDEYWKKRQALGRLYNFRNTIENCKGKYIALLDGDDYWTDHLKLARQVQFLEGNPDYSICFHQSAALLDNGSMRPYNTFTNDQSFGFVDLVERNFIATASCIYRNPRKPLPNWFERLPAGDWGIHLLNADQGKIFYLNRTMSVYRVHKSGLWSKLTTTEMISRHVQILRILDEGFDHKYHSEFKKVIKQKKKKLASSRFPKKQLIRFAQIVMKSMWK